MQGEKRYLLLKKEKHLLFILLVTISFFYHSFQRTERIDWDVFGYYLYLPAKFIHNDINLGRKTEWLEPAISKYKLTDSFYQAYQSPSRKYVFKYTMGMSVLYSPFFFAADAFVRNTNLYERDGFSLPYQIAMRFFVFTMILLGLFYLYKTLRIYFSENNTLFALFLLVFGTNYYVMSFADGLMPHLSLFTLFSILLFYTIQWYQQQKIKFAAIIGVCLGMAVLIRPTSAVVVLIPILWGVYGIQAFSVRMLLLLSNFRQLLILILLAFTVLLPQLLYWHTQTGEWLFYSYPDEKLNFFKPHLAEVFF
ncbi:MAG: glycosyltransferase family 39 protein [Flavobacteriales bacterium]|nr:glycosyltransferase family 39 protein [Flavobacteriales bacterium]